MKRLLNWFASRQRKLEDEFERELHYDFERRTSDLIRGGLAEPEAKRQAKLQLGGMTQVRESVRDEWLIRWVRELFYDLRVAARSFLGTPSFTAIALLSLALGIGANTAIFTLINAVMLQSLPVREPSRLTLFYDGISSGVYSGDTVQSEIFSYPFWEYLQERHEEVFESLSAFRQGSDRVIFRVSGSEDNGPLERATVHLVSGSYFDVLGVSAYTGRVLTPSDDTPSAKRVAVMSYPFWRDRFGQDPGILGREVVLNETAFLVAGVADRNFFGERIESAPDFWLPLTTQPEILRRESWMHANDVYWLNLIGRRAPGVGLTQAEGAVNFHFQQFYLKSADLSEEKRREVENTGIALKPGGGGISGLRYRYSEPLHLLMAVVAVVLLIACANIATLLLARSLPRRQDFLIRLALGASRNRLLRQVLTESVLLSVCGSLVGIGVAWWSVKALVSLLGVNPVVQVGPNAAVLGFTLTLSVLTGVLFGIIPAFRISRLEAREGVVPKSVRIDHRGVSSAQGLIALQVALSVTLLLGAGLLARSLLALESQEVGFRPDNVLVIRTDASLAGYTESELLPLYRGIADHFSALPDLVSASICRFTPVSGSSSSSTFSIQGLTESGSEELNVYHLPVGPRFFETLGIPLLLGRTISHEDAPGTPAVVVVNQTFVDRYLPNQNPLGRRIALGAPFAAPGALIIGVVGDSKYFDLREQAKPMAFFSIWQEPAADFEIVLRTAGPSDVAAEARQTISQVSSNLPILGINTLNAQIEESLDQHRLLTALCSMFGVLALVLASVGIYGTLAYYVSGRTTEIGIRMAIGAQKRQVVWMVVRDSLVVIAVGLVVGLPLALGTTRWLKSFLFEVGPTDRFAIAGAVLLTCAVSVLAGYFPARRAAGIDPMRAVRHE